MHYALSRTMRQVNWMRREKGSGDGYEKVMHTARMSLSANTPNLTRMTDMPRDSAH
jgi:hypothetical protein